MQLKNSIHILILFLLFSSVSEGGLSKLKVVVTKQDIANLRFFSGDGKFSIYQRRSGSLLYSTNYKVSEIIKGEPGTNFVARSSPARKIILIEQKNEYYTNFNIRKSNEIFKLNFNGTGLKLMGKGVASKLHLNDTWCSFYDSGTKNLNFINIENETLKFSIKIKNPFNPYYEPQSMMLSEDKILFTDLNEKGEVGLISFNRKERKFDTILKLSSPEVKVELCEYLDSIYISQFGVNTSNIQSTITRYSKINFNLDKGKIIYESKGNEIGNVICDYGPEKIYFVQMTYAEKNSYSSEAVSLELNSGKVTVLSDLGNVSQILNIDGRLLVPFKGTFYLLDGTNNIFDDSLNTPVSSAANDPFGDNDKKATPETPVKPSEVPAAPPKEKEKK